MLTNLHVKNMALIREEDISFENGLNILTGETGAGKSILIGSINAALGIGSMKDMLPEGKDQSLVELTFTAEGDNVRKKLRQMELEADEDTIVISRKFQNGRSVSRINGETVPLKAVRELAGELIDIHGQNEHQSLLRPATHRAFLDKFAARPMGSLLSECRVFYHEYMKAEEELSSSSMDEAERAKKADLLSFEYNEIEEASVREGEDEELESIYRRMSNAQQIMESLSAAHELLSGDGGASEQTGRALKSLLSVASLDPELSELADQLSEAENLLSDFSRALGDCTDQFSYDEETYYQTSRRLDLLNHLKHKYGGSLKSVLEYQAGLAQELKKLDDYEAYRKQLTEKRDQSLAAYDAVARKISAVRCSQAPELEHRITEALLDLNFPDVRFRVSVENTDSRSEYGCDRVVFQISTNPGVTPRPVWEVASGGEMSRIMLAMKAVMAAEDEIGTLIFDEIDTGISGRTAQKVSEKMAVIACSHQVLCITHLAQIAAMADHHFEITKGLRDGNFGTHIRELSGEESVRELERILGGVSITKAVEESAREMKHLADERKSEIMLAQNSEQKMHKIT